jgi:hypothetical protein
LLPVGGIKSELELFIHEKRNSSFTLKEKNLICNYQLLKIKEKKKEKGK